MSADRISYTIAEASEATGLSRDTLYRRHQTGDITLVKAGRRTLVTRADLEHLVGSLPALPRHAA